MVWLALCDYLNIEPDDYQDVEITVDAATVVKKLDDTEEIVL